MQEMDVQVNGLSKAQRAAMKHYTNIEHLLSDAIANPLLVLANPDLGEQLDLFAKSGMEIKVLEVLRELARQCPSEFLEASFVPHILNVLRNTSSFNVIFGNMNQVISASDLVLSLGIEGVAAQS